MSTSKDHPAVITFMALFAKLRDMINDDPADLETLAASDLSVRRVCLALANADIPLQTAMRWRRHTFIRPVNPQFNKVWRDYEERYACPLAGILLADLGGTSVVGRQKRRIESSWRMTKPKYLPRQSTQS